VRIAILGAGAMGSLFGGYLSLHNDVWLMDVDEGRVKKIQNIGIAIREQNRTIVYRPNAVSNSSNLHAMDLVIVFVKAMYTIAALSQNQNLINSDTYIMTLQNGIGHEEKLENFTDVDHVIIGMTQHNSSINSDGSINHGGGGDTTIGILSGDSSRIQHIADNFSNCGIQTSVSDEVKEQIWKKLFLNTAASSLTAVLQVPLGYLIDNPHACAMMEQLAREAVDVANSECKYQYKPDEVISIIKQVIANAKGGYTSIYSDLKNGNRSEVDTISGSVVSSAKQHGISAPCHEFIVSMIHAMEDKQKLGKLE